MAVRYDKKFMAEINRTINAFNRKITRLSKAGGYTLPKRFTREDLTRIKETSRTRADVRKRLKDLQSFTARGGEKMISIKANKIPRYQYENVKRYRRILAAKTSRKLKRYETTRPISGGKIQPLTFAQTGSREYLTLRAKKDILMGKTWETMTPKEITDYLNQLIANTTEKVIDTWQENYVGILEDTALSYGYDTEKLEELVTTLKNLTPEKFEELAFRDKNIQAILYSYQALKDIQSSEELADVSDDVVNNLDSIYENLDDILKTLG